MKWLAPLLAYLAVGFGILYFHNAWGALLGFHASILVSMFIAKPDIHPKILLASSSNKWISLNILVCGASGVILYIFWDCLGFASDFSSQVASLGLHPSNWPLFLAYFSLVNPFVEEYFWRGYLGSETKSLHVSDLIYAGFHAFILFNKVQTGSFVFGLCMLVLAGWSWRQVLREDGGLFAPVLGHMAADFAILSVVYRML